MALLYEVANLPPSASRASGDLGEQVRTSLRAHSAAFLAAGGALDLATWAGLDAEERGAFLWAALQDERARAWRRLQGTTTRGWGRAYAEADDGAAHDDALVLEATLRAAGRAGDAPAR